MSTNFPPYTVIACTDWGDFPDYAHDPDWAAALITLTAGTRGVGCVILERNQVEVGRAKTDDPEAVADLIASIEDDAPVETAEPIEEIAA